MSVLVVAMYVVSLVVMAQGGTFTFLTEPWVVLPNPFAPDAAAAATTPAAVWTRNASIGLNVAYWTASALLFAFYACLAFRRRGDRLLRRGAKPLRLSADAGYFDAVSLVFFLLLWNPLSTNLVVRLTANLDVDVSWLFFLAVTPSFFNRLMPRKKGLRAAYLVLLALCGLTVNGLIAAANFAPA